MGGRFGTTILELGGNNAVVVMDDADLDMALPTIMFAAAGIVRHISLSRDKSGGQEFFLEYG